MTDPHAYNKTPTSFSIAICPTTPNLLWLQDNNQQLTESFIFPIIVFTEK